MTNCMFLNRLTSVAALCLALLLLSGGIAEAGYVCPGTALGDDSTFGAQTSGATAPQKNWNAASHRRLVINVDDSKSERPAGTFVPGGMTSPTESGASPTSISVALPTLSRPLVISMVSWVGAEGRSALPPPLSTGIFRPPRWIAC